MFLFKCSSFKNHIFRSVLKITSIQNKGFVLKNFYVTTLTLKLFVKFFTTIRSIIFYFLLSKKSKIKTRMQSSKSHFENVLTILPQGHDEALKKAFYNIATLLFVAIVSAIAICIYYIMHAFLRPLLWALLCGTFLFPFKNHLATTSKRWLNELSSSETPLCVGVFFLPFKLVNSIFDHMIETCWYNKKIISLCCVCVLTIILGVHFWPIPFLTRLLFSFLDYSGSIITVFSSYWVSSQKNNTFISKFFQNFHSYIKLN